MNYAIILAGGTGSRAGGPLPKQFQMVAGRRMLWWSVLAFREFDPEVKIVLAIHPDYIQRFGELFPEEDTSDLILTEGGATRIESVENALKAISSLALAEDKVFIHDAARPAVTSDLIYRGSETVGSGVGAVPVVPLSDSIRQLIPEGSKAVDRAGYVAVQTPQIFLFEDIRKAYSGITDTKSLTDDASVAERAGIKISTFPGDTANLKVTNPEDFHRIL